MKSSKLIFALLALFLGVTQITAQTTEQNKAVVRNFWETFTGQRSTDACLPLLAENFKMKFNGQPEMDRNAYKGLGDAFLGAFPDLKIEIISLVAEGDVVVANTRATGTQKGPLPGIPATGKAVDYDGINIFTVKNGKITAGKTITDDVTFLQQLGVMPKM